MNDSIVKIIINLNVLLFYESIKNNVPVLNCNLFLDSKIQIYIIQFFKLLINFIFVTILSLSFFYLKHITTALFKINGTQKYTTDILTADLKLISPLNYFAITIIPIIKLIPEPTMIALFSVAPNIYSLPFHIYSYLSYNTKS